MSYYDYQTASLARSRGLPWQVRLEYTGYNGNNDSGSSYKFWEASGRPGQSSVTIRYGRIGSSGRALQKDWSYFAEKFPEKQAKGYAYDSRTQSQLPTGSPVITDNHGVVEITVSSSVASGFGTGPYGQIRKVVRSHVAHGFTWVAYDADGNLVMNLPESGVAAIEQAVTA